MTVPTLVASAFAKKIADQPPKTPEQRYSYRGLIKFSAYCVVFLAMIWALIGTGLFVWNHTIGALPSINLPDFHSVTNTELIGKVKLGIVQSESQLETAKVPFDVRLNYQEGTTLGQTDVSAIDGKSGIYHGMGTAGISTDLTKVIISSSIAHKTMQLKMPAMTIPSDSVSLDWSASSFESTSCAFGNHYLTWWTLGTHDVCYLDSSAVQPQLVSMVQEQVPANAATMKAAEQKTGQLLGPIVQSIIQAASSKQFVISFVWPDGTMYVYQPPARSTKPLPVS